MDGSRGVIRPAAEQRGQFQWSRRGVGSRWSSLLYTPTSPHHTPYTPSPPFTPPLPPFTPLTPQPHSLSALKVAAPSASQSWQEGGGAAQKSSSHNLHVKRSGGGRCMSVVATRGQASQAGPGLYGVRRM